MWVLLWPVIGVIGVLSLGALATLVIRLRAARRHPPEGTVSPVPGGRLHWIEEGPRDAHTVLCLHGYTGQAFDFTYALSGLLAEDLRVIALDRPGWGHSSREREINMAPEEQARMIAVLMRRIRTGPATIVAHGQGAPVAFYLALNHPDVVARLVLLAPDIIPFDDIRSDLRRLQLYRAWMRFGLAHTLGMLMYRWALPRVNAQSFHGDVMPPPFRDGSAAVMARMPNSIVAASEELVAWDYDLPDVVARLPQVSAPVSVLFGATTPFVNRDENIALLEESLDQLRIEIIPDTAYMLPVTRAPQVAAFVRDSIAREV